MTSNPTKPQFQRVDHDEIELYTVTIEDLCGPEKKCKHIDTMYFGPLLTPTAHVKCSYRENGNETSWVEIGLRVKGSYLLWTKLKALREIGKVSFTGVMFTDPIPGGIFINPDPEVFDVQTADELFAKLGR